MPKTIVKIASDPAVALIKCFRNINLQAGKAKAAGQEFEFIQMCAKLTVLADKAETMGFHIWVNENGKTGHDYPKDYKETPDADNDYETYITNATARMQTRMTQAFARYQVVGSSPLDQRRLLAN